MKIIYISVLFFLTISCCSTKQNESSIKKNEITENQLKERTQFQIIYSSSYGGYDEFTHLIIENSTDLNSEIEKLNILNEIPNVNEVDFRTNAVLFLHLGQKNTGGYKIEIEKIEKLNDELIIYFNTITPSKGENVTMALTNPYCIAIIPKAKKYSIK